MVAALGPDYYTSFTFACRGPQCCTLVSVYVGTFTCVTIHLFSDYKNNNALLHVALDRPQSTLAYISNSDGCLEIIIPT